MMYFYLDPTAEALFRPIHTVVAAPAVRPQDGLNWHVYCDRIGEVPVCVLIEDQSRYALIFTHIGEQFIRRLPQVLSTRLTTHLMLLLEAPARTHTAEVEALADLYRTLMDDLNRTHAFMQGTTYGDDTLETVWREIRDELQQLPSLPDTLDRMTALDVQLNRQLRPVGEDTVLPCDAFRDLMGLYVSARLMRRPEAERFLNHLGASVGLAPQTLAHPTD